MLNNTKNGEVDMIDIAIILIVMVIGIALGIASFAIVQMINISLGE